LFDVTCRFVSELTSYTHIYTLSLHDALPIYDSLYVVGGRGDAYAKLHQDIMHFVNSAYKHYKPIGVATTGENYIQTSEKNNLAGVVFAADNPNFGKEFVSAIAKQRFWNRT